MNLIKVYGCFFFLFRLHKPVSYPYCFCLFFYVPKRVRLQFLAIISFSYVVGMEPNGLTTVMAFWGQNRRSQTYGTVSVPTHAEQHAKNRTSLCNLDQETLFLTDPLLT